MFKNTRRALSLLLGASMLQSGVASAGAHCEPVAPPEAHQHHTDAPAPADPAAPDDLPDCCVALGSCTMGTFVVPSDEERGLSAIADRVDDVISGIPTSRQPPPDPPPPRA